MAKTLTRIAYLGLLGLALAVTAAVALAAPPVIKVENRKFDHDKHSQLSAAAGKPAACAACHTLDANGAPKAGREHPRCAQCHTYPRSCDVMKTAGPKGQARICGTCHTSTTNKCLPPDLPPQPKTDSFQARFTHGKHLTLGTSIEKDCVLCHADKGTNAPAATGTGVHKLCSGCHNANGAKPAMSECQSCHQAPRGKTPAAPDPYRLGGFDHRAHHTASRQSSCTGCHDKLLGAGETALPRPSMLGCQTRCHDGQKAFNAVGTRCTACHKGKEPAPALRQDMGFSHEKHAGRNMQMQNCGQCHSIESDGRLPAPLAKKDHQPCAQSSCHLNEFASRTTKICGVCHDSAAPWGKTVSRAKASPKPEWFERIDHSTHLAKIGTANTACASCHGDKLAGASPPQGHDACAPCHGKGQGPAMAQCAACHAQTPPARAIVSAWSVKSTFAHKQHAIDPRGATRGTPTKCTECHKRMDAAKDLVSIKAPAMADCEGCHDGKHQFKTTGFECSKCHARSGGDAKPAPAAAPVTLREFVPVPATAPTAVSAASWSSSGLLVAR